MAKTDSVSKDYILDTNVLLEDSNCIQTLNDNGQNKIYIPFEVLMELDHLKMDTKRGYLARRAINSIVDNIKLIQIIGYDERFDNTDIKILNRILETKPDYENPVLVSNDRMLGVLSKIKNIPTEIYENSQPFITKSELYTGIVNKKENLYNNCFYETKRETFFCDPYKGLKKFEIKHNILNIKPKDKYQNMAMELMTKSHIDVVTMASKAGTGKTFIALAVALNYIFNTANGKYEKIYITKPTIEVGNALGFLPGNVDEKVKPFMMYLHSLLNKICLNSPNQRVKEIFKNKNVEKMDFNEKFFQVLTLQFIRGLDLENCVVILDETQNMDRNEVRTFLSRMGQNTKVFCLGDPGQIDHPHLNKYNNGINWIVDKFYNEPNYAHIVLNGDHTRGPICNMVNKTGL